MVTAAGLFKYVGPFYYHQALKEGQTCINGTNIHGENISWIKPKLLLKYNLQEM